VARKKIELPSGVVPAALNLPQAAVYVGVCPGTMAGMVRQGLMPPPRVVGTRKIWVIRDLDAALARLPTAGGNSWEAA
jgi:hypothetical protein